MSDDASRDREWARAVAPWAVALFTCLVQWWLWSAREGVATIHDESAYLLQARIFASGRLTAEPPTLPEFFEQYHVLLEPRLAPKYFPGHALALVPGIWLDFAPLGPIALAGAAGGLIFAFARSLAGPWVASLTWAVWLTAPRIAEWRTSYFSQNSSLVLWLVAAWIASRWSRGAGSDWGATWIPVLGAAALLTRPWTALALGAPLGLAVLIAARRRGRWRELALGSVLGLVVLAALPWWSRAVTGDWRTTAYASYREQYIPWDRLGFGLDETPPQRALPPDMQDWSQWFREVHARHTVAALPATIVERVRHIASDQWGGAPWRAALLPFFFVGLARLPREATVGLGWCVALVAAHAFYAHPPRWSIYYLESQPVLAFLTALGLTTAFGWLAARRRPPLARLGRMLPSLSLFGLLAAGSIRLFDLRHQLAASSETHRAFDRALATIPDAAAIVFVRNTPWRSPHRALLANPPDHAAARIWIVYDRGADNRRLLELAPERRPYLYDQSSGTLTPWPAER